MVMPPNYNQDMENRLKTSEDNIQRLLGTQIGQIEAQRQARDKEISIRQIVEDERKIIEERFRKDIEQLKAQQEVQTA